MVFFSVFFVLTYTIYSNSMLCYFAIGLAFVVVLALGVCAKDSYENRIEDEQHHEPKWFMFLTVTALVAFVTALVSGSELYSDSMKTYREYTTLNTYMELDPLLTHGAEAMDAGRVLFVDGSMIDLNLTSGFKNDVVYCVAPISVSTAKLDHYDFWAVGTNCCTTSWKNFSCGDVLVPQTHGALRSLSESARPYYRLAVQQAEAAFNISAPHPLFFEWTKDPVARVNQYRTASTADFVMGVVIYLVFQTTVVLIATLAYSKRSRR